MKNRPSFTEHHQKRKLEYFRHHTGCSTEENTRKMEEFSKAIALEQKISVQNSHR